MRHLELIADGVIAACKSHVASALAPFAARLDALAKQLTELPIPKDGAPGEPGAKGDPGDSVTADDIRPLVAEAVTAAVAALPAPKDGEPGVKGDPGKDAEPVNTVAIAAEVLAQIPAPKDGKDADPEFIRAEVARAVDAIPRPKGGEPGKNGEPGKSVTLDDVRPLFDAAFAGWALDFERRAADVQQRALDRMPVPKNGVDGLSIEDLSVADDGDGNVTLTFSRGEVSRAFTIRLPRFKDCDVYRDGDAYLKGDAVSWGGSLFLARKDSPLGKPGESDDWRLAVKRGRDGKDAPQTAPMPRTVNLK